jgi:Ni/Fe-hydrogenase subunit HybB-like protein
MKKTVYSVIQGNSPAYMALLALLGFFVLAAMGSSYYMEHHGHVVTGMHNKVVWGIPHVFAIFLIIAASGALNVASIGTVFNKTDYKPLGRLSALLAIALLAGGLLVLVLDLGRIDRLLVTVTHANFKSIFAWNIYLYTVFFGLVAVYIWFMMERKMQPYYRAAGIAAFIWRLILTTGTGSIFGFLVARQAYDAAIMAPMFIIMSFSFGLAIFILVLSASYNWTKRPLGDAVFLRLKNLLGVFISAVLYFSIVFHLANLYATEHHDVEHFILVSGGAITAIFWFGHILLGSLIPLFLLYHPHTKDNRSMSNLAALLVIIGGICQVYVILISGQAFPLELFPGMEVLSSSFYDGQITSYSPSLPEITLGLGGIAMSLAIVAVGVKVLNFLPSTLADQSKS